MTAPKVYLCRAVDAVTNQCTEGEWVNYVSFFDHLPTVEQANTVGWALFASVAILASLLLIKPQKENDQ